MQLSKIVKLLSKVRGVKAIALGGSRSRDEADEHSDFDLGLYYQADILDLAALEKTLQTLDDDHRENTLNPPGEWGPWINGGAWLTFERMPVDILLRDLQTVANVVNDCIGGKITIDYQCGHPFGFVNTIYAAETHYCRPLWQDESVALDQLKTLLYSQGEYSPKMREAVIRKFLWEAWFSLTCGRKAALKGDLNYAMGSMFRTVCSWVEVLYAVNNLYLMNEKGALSRISHLNYKPIGFEKKVKIAYKLFADGCADSAYPMLDELHMEVGSLTGGIQPIGTPIR